jgi:hypothetical protein
MEIVSRSSRGSSTPIVTVPRSPFAPRSRRAAMFGV